MIAAEDAQAAGIVLEAFGQAKFHREIGDDRLFHFGIVALIPGVFATHIFVKRLADAIQLGQEAGIVGGGVQLLLA